LVVSRYLSLYLSSVLTNLIAFGKGAVIFLYDHSFGIDAGLKIKRSNTKVYLLYLLVDGLTNL
jgi:hypothetical protein